LDKEENFTNDRLNGLLVGGSAERQQFGALVDQGVGVIDQNDQSAPASQSRGGIMPRKRKGAVR